MVKYSDKPEYTHEQMELSTAYDLRNARVVQAQINSIDAAENCAAITLAGECAELAEKSVEAVKFFYHCENSTGTVEDLARGYKAFKANDFVIVLWVPASGEMEEQFYIIGHVDIRGTKTCSAAEFILIKAYAATLGTYFTIFDTSTLTVLDIEAFENIDEESPAKPATVPGQWTTAVSNWFAYNFASPTPREGISATVTDDTSGASDQTYLASDIEWEETLTDWGGRTYVHNETVYKYISDGELRSKTVFDHDYIERYSDTSVNYWKSYISTYSFEAHVRNMFIVFVDTITTESLKISCKLDISYALQYGIKTGTEEILVGGYEVPFCQDGLSGVGTMSFGLQSDDLPNPTPFTTLSFNGIDRNRTITGDKIMYVNVTTGISSSLTTSPFFAGESNVGLAIVKYYKTYTMKNPVSTAYGRWGVAPIEGLIEGPLYDGLGSILDTLTHYYPYILTAEISCWCTLAMYDEVESEHSLNAANCVRYASASRSAALTSEILAFDEYLVGIAGGKLDTRPKIKSVVIYRGINA